MDSHAVPGSANLTDFRGTIPGIKILVIIHRGDRRDREGFCFLCHSPR